VQGLTVDLVGDVRAVEVGVVDVVHPTGNRLAQHNQDSILVFWGTKYAGSGKLHSAVAEPLYRAVAESIGVGGVY